MKPTHSLTLSGAVFTMLFALSTAAKGEPIDMSAVQLEPQQQNGMTYLSGGIGLDESRAIQRVKGYNLHMTFSTGPANEYLPDIDVVIQTVKGRSVLSLSQVGPITYVKLPVDRYLIVSSVNGHEKRQIIAITSRSTRTVNFHWKDEP
jgi:hypothetical protein